MQSTLQDSAAPSTSVGVIAMGEPGHSRDRTLAPRSALAVAKTSMHVINALPEMPLAIDAREKGTTVHCVSPRLSRRFPKAQVTSRLHSSTV